MNENIFKTFYEKCIKISNKIIGKKDSLPVQNILYSNLKFGEVTVVFECNENENIVKINGKIINYGDAKSWHIKMNLLFTSEQTSETFDLITRYLAETDENSSIDIDVAIKIFQFPPDGYYYVSLILEEWYDDRWNSADQIQYLDIYAEVKQQQIIIHNSDKYHNTDRYKILTTTKNK